MEYSAGSPVPPLGRILSKSAGNQAITGGPIATVNKIEVYPKISGKLCKDQLDSITSISNC